MGNAEYMGILGSEFAGIRVGFALCLVEACWERCRCSGFRPRVAVFFSPRWGGAECGVGPPAVGFVLASVTTLLRGTSGVQPQLKLTSPKWRPTLLNTLPRS